LFNGKKRGVSNERKKKEIFQGKRTKNVKRGGSFVLGGGEGPRGRKREQKEKDLRLKGVRPGEKS